LSGTLLRTFTAGAAWLVTPRIPGSSRTFPVAAERPLTSIVVVSPSARCGGTPSTLRSPTIGSSPGAAVLAFRIVTGAV
jgi:hypothetical protein